MNEQEEFEFRLRLEREMQAPKAQASKPEPSMMDSVKQGAGNAVAGLVRGAGSIGATLLPRMTWQRMR
jgi:hypothetical protein